MSWLGKKTMIISTKDDDEKEDDDDSVSTKDATTWKLVESRRTTRRNKEMESTQAKCKVLKRDRNSEYAQYGSGGTPPSSNIERERAA